MSNILISTKLITTNIGNEALSNELISMSLQNCKDDVLKFVGRPFGLDRYTIDQLDENHLVEDFEKLANRIAKSIGKVPAKPFKASNPDSAKTNLLLPSGVVVKTEKLRDIARKIRKSIYSLIPYSHHYKERASYYKNTDFYLYSGAGEVGPQNYFYRQLLDLRVAQLLGVKTCAINQSVELPAGKYRDVVAHVYSKMHRLVVRGEITKQELIKMGASESSIFVCPDTAFHNQGVKGPKPTLGKNIALNFTNKTFKKDQIEPVIEKLLANDYKISFVTNQPDGDSTVAKHLNQKYNIPYDFEYKSYKDYCQFMHQFNFIISSRLHTNELALTAGVPVIPIEGNIHKTTEVLAFVDYPIKPVSYKADDYGAMVYENVLFMENNFGVVQQWIEEKLDAVAHDTKGNVLKAASMN